MFRVLSQTGETNFNLSIVKVIGEKRTFSPENVEYLVVNEDGKEFYVGANRVFETANEAKLALENKAKTIYDEAVTKIFFEASAVSEKLSLLNQEE